MNAGTLITLARLRARRDADRTLLLACAVAAACGLCLVAARVVRLWWADPAELDRYSSPALSQYLLDPGVRPGVVLAALLLMVPVLAFVGQALRVGSSSRDRGSAVLRLAGATPRDTRWISALESGVGAALGGVLGGPAYLVLWLLLGRWAPPRWSFIPEPGWPDAIVWAALIVVAGAAGAVAGALVGRRVRRDPIGVSRRTPGGPNPLRLLVIAPVLLVGVVAVVLGRNARDNGALGATVVVIAVIVSFPLTAAPWAVLGLARLAQRSRDPARVLAGHRLASDPWSPARATGVLTICGIALGVVAYLVAETPSPAGDGERLFDDFYVQGYTAVGGCVLVAVVVAVATLFVGAVDRLVDGPRPIAALHALGVDESTLRRVLRTELMLTTVPACMLGVLLGAVAMVTVFGYSPVQRFLALVVAVTLLGAAALVGLAAVAVSSILRQRLNWAVDPENLRTV